MRRFSSRARLSLVVVVSLVACSHREPTREVSPSATPEGLVPTDGRAMGIARLADEKCEAVYEDVAHAQGWFSGKASDRLKSRMGKPDGTRKGGEVYWLAVDRAGQCNEYVADPDGSIGHGSLPARDCGVVLPGSPSASSGPGAAPPPSASSGDRVK